MEDFCVNIDLVCVKVGELQTFHDDEFDVDLSYRECFFVNEKTHSYIKFYRVCDFVKVEVGKTYRFNLSSIKFNSADTWLELLEEV